MPETATVIAPLDHDLALKTAALVKVAADAPILDATGAPSKFTPDVLTRLIAAIRLGHTVADACTYAGVRPSTYSHWLRKGQDGTEPYSLLVDVIDRLNVETYTSAVQCFKTHAANDPKIAERFLARRARKEWGTEQEQASGGVTVVFGLALKGSAE